MESVVKAENEAVISPPTTQASAESTPPTTKTKSRTREKDFSATAKRRCVSTACIACRKRKSKCDGKIPKCAACASVYLTECEYAPHTDHRRKGVYKKDIDSLKTRNSTLQTLVQAILNYDEEDVLELVHQIRTCESLEDLAESIVAREKGLLEQKQKDSPDSPVYSQNALAEIPQFEQELSGKMGDLLLEGSVKFVGGTSNLIWLPPGSDSLGALSPSSQPGDIVRPREEAVLSWTTITQDKEFILHLVNMYFCWHYAFFTTLSKELFMRDFLQGRVSSNCSALLVNIMLALGCHFSSRPDARDNPEDSATTGNHFFREAKRLMYENDELGNAQLCTVQALALMSVREAGCGREGKGWVYSGMSFRMAADLGLPIDAPAISENSTLKDEEIDARRITFWGCFLFDKCWSNYLGRIPILQIPNVSVKKPEVFPHEESELWSPYTDSGVSQSNVQPARTRAVALQISKLAEISSDLLLSFYNPSQLDKPMGKQAELRKLSDLHTRLEAWKKDLPREMEPKEGQLPQVLLMHMFFQLLFIHLYRPFLKYTRSTSPLPSHVSPQKYCTQAAGAISKLLRLYKRTYGLRQICNIAVYIAHSACTIHLLNLPDKNAKRDIIHGVKHLEEIGDCWTCARRTLLMLHISAQKWKIELPEEAATTFTRTESKWTSELGTSPNSDVGYPNKTSPQSNGRSPQSSTDPPLNGQPLEMTHSSIPHVHNGPLPGFAPYPVSSASDTRRSSGGHSLPPKTAQELARAASRNKPVTQLSKEQQDRWNAHQAVRVQSTVNGVGKANTATANAAVLFGGVESLVEESQDWWLKDQSALALGFDNWIDTGGEWSGMSLNPTNGSSKGSAQGFKGVGTSMVAGSGNLPDYDFTSSVQDNPSHFDGLGFNSGASQPYMLKDEFDDEMYF